MTYELWINLIRQNTAINCKTNPVLTNHEEFIEKFVNQKQNFMGKYKTIEDKIIIYNTFP
jgi:hypothetical protein